MKKKTVRRKVTKSLTAIKQFMLNVRKELSKMKAKLTKIWCILALFVITFSSCGTVVKAAVSQPKDTSVTTITISTNTPVETKVDPNTNVEFNKEKH